ncbi:hypothetical protein AB0C04_12445 [Micromonospora sp. NPDC048909]|uniref:hypothetical protein n=1 Tax=Micromonospora sp. NPDC048909 TaxID=3155643 RepID=UPI0033EA7557
MLTVSVVTGLVVQAVTVIGVHAVVRGEWLRRPGALLLAAAVVFHGVTEVMQALWPDRNVFRTFVDQKLIDDWVLLVSVAIAAYGIGYAAVVARERKKHRPAHTHHDAGLAGLRLPWLLALVIPLLAATWSGNGALQPLAPAQAGLETPERQGIMVDLASGFLVPLIAVTGAVILVRYGIRWVIPVLAVECALLALAGTRAMIVIGCVLTLSAAALHDVKPTRRQVASIVLVAAAFTALISATRSTSGREAFDAGQDGNARLEALTKGAGAIHTERSREAIVNDVVYRFDGNTFGAIILGSLNGHTQPVGLETMSNNLEMQVPSLLSPEKVESRSLEERSEEAYLGLVFGLDQYVDWLPTIFGTVVAYFGPVGLIFLALLLGLAIGSAEAAALRAVTIVRVTFAVGLAQCALLYGSGPQAVITTLRLVLVLAAVLWVVSWLRLSAGRVAASRTASPARRVRPTTPGRTERPQPAWLAGS